MSAPSVEIRYFAAARAAAGVASEHVEPGAAGATSLVDVLDAVRARHDARFADVLTVCSLLVDGAPVGRRDPASVPVGEGSVVEVLPPFAGG
ncbi:MAG: MoaD/ThiS family protein [Mycobacteriales bacterium]|nr:MoaD/ThiS family protein [Mycobacteriales bacterium]